MELTAPPLCRPQTCTADESISVEDLNRCACNSKLRAGFIACAKCIDDPAIPALVSGEAQIEQRRRGRT